jgi:hypothetical protein
LLILVVGLLFAFSSARGSAAQVFHDLERLLAGIYGDTQGPQRISSSPSFTVFLPSYLPKGFEYISTQYFQGDKNLPSVQEERIWPGTQAVLPTISPDEEHYSDNQPFILIQYKGSDGQYINLFQRKTHPNEELSIGQTIIVNEKNVRMQKNGATFSLAWIDAGTWIELTGRITEQELLKVVEGLKIIQTPENGELIPPEFISTEEPPYCDPSKIAPKNQPLMGEVEGQHEKGSVWIHLFESGKYPVTESISYGSNVMDARDEVLEPALKALLDPTIPMQRLPYWNIGMVTWSDRDKCLKPVDIQGYIVIEVWDNLVNIGYGGDGAELKERAIQVLQMKIQGLP